MAVCTKRFHVRFVNIIPFLSMRKIVSKKMMDGCLYVLYGVYSDVFAYGCLLFTVLVFI
jgi:hypothetical protein